MNRDEEWLLNEKYQGERTDEFFVDCDRLKQGEPLAYVIGHVPFIGTTIFLDTRPLIPRAETEFWVHKIIEDVKNDLKRSAAPLRVLDLCAGSGCIGVAVLSELSKSRVDFAEIDAGHHSTIQKNIEANNIESSRTHIFGGDLYENISDTYDIILSNPPYIDKTLGRTADSVLRNEPHIALFAEAGGLALIQRIIENANNYLDPKGKLVIEHEPEQSAFINSFGQDKGFNSETKCDQYGVERYTILTIRE